MEKLIGITSSQHNELLKEFGPNKLPEPKIDSPLVLLINQFKNLFTALLIAAVIISFAFGDLIDGSLILIILLLNAGLSFWQEYKASKEISMLRNYEPP